MKWQRSFSIGYAVRRQAAHSAVTLATALHVLVGVGAIVVAILALIGFIPVVLSLISLLALGAASVLSGVSVASRIAGTGPRSGSRADGGQQAR
jgi:hypothetical protein